MVAVPGTRLDTDRASDHNAIVDLIGLSTTMTSAQVSELLVALDAKQGRTAFEDDLRRDVRLLESRMLDVEYVRDKAVRGGVWAAGRAMFGADYEHVFTTNAFSSGTGQGTYALVGDDVSAGELRASWRDCEVPVLDALSENITEAMRTVTATLYVAITGSMGPCLGCQGRIARFIHDLNSVARNIHVQVPVVVESRYTTVLQPAGTPSLPRNTQYGYTTATTHHIPNSPVGQYWSKTFVGRLGAARQMVVTTNPP